MKNIILSFILVSVFSILSLSYFKFQNNQSQVYEADLSSVAVSSPYGKIDDLKSKFVKEVASKITDADLLTSEKLESIIQKFNTTESSNPDGLDQFISMLPTNYRRHFSLIHQSRSIQKATPHSPRVILYGPDAKVMMTFNGGHDEANVKMDGGDSIEVIEWNAQKLIWQFSEIKLDLNRKLVQEKNPPKCIMCHAGTPKPVDYKNASFYFDKLKPIFPQYPFWPGFYGSVNDVVGLKRDKTKDSIMLNLKDTIAQIKGLTFSETEELFRLRKLLDENPKYLKIVENEQDVHLKNFVPFIESMKSRSRYRHLLTLKDLFTEKSEKVPEYLQAAPFRRTFDIEYGHYLLRPNFYLSSLLTYYHSQYVAQEIANTPVFEQVKFSFLARKFNCGPLEVDGLKISELDPSFDLLYPNLASQEIRDRQYLLAYQYNVVASQKSGSRHLPLHAWNLEGNEDIASYHYGNVFADLNEVVLWNLARRVLPSLTANLGRSGAEERHYILPESNFLKNYLDRAGGFISRLNNKEYLFANTLNSYYGTQTKFKALPASAQCDSHFKPAALAEMKKLAQLKKENKLPNQIYILDSRLYQIEDIYPNQKPGLTMVRSACESCHTSQNEKPEFQIKPFLNVDWSSASYGQDLHQSIKTVSNQMGREVELKKAIDEVLDRNTLPEPFENRMPYGRRELSDFSLVCEKLIIERSYSAQKTLAFIDLFNCSKENPQVDLNSIDCRCKKLILRKDKVYNDLYKN